MKFLHSTTDLTSWEIPIVSGLYKGLHIRISGTNNTSQTLAKGNVGNFTLSLNGAQIMFLPDVFLTDLNNQWFGYNEFSSTVSSSFTYGLFIPFFIPKFPNGLFVAPEDKMYLGLQVGSTISTVVSSWSIEINGLATGNVEQYVPKFYPANETVSAAVTYKKRIPGRNIYEVWVQGSSITQLQLERDGDLIHQASYNALLSETSLRNRVEGSLATYVSLPCGDQVSDLLSDAVDLQFTASGSTTANIMSLAVEGRSTRKARSVEVRQSQVQRRLDVLRSDPIQVDAVTTLSSVEKAS